MYFIIIAIFITYLLQNMFPGFTQTFYFDPTQPMQIWRWISSLFLHANLNHLLFNCLAIFMFSPILINNIGKKEYYKIFFIGGIFANLCYYIYTLITVPAPALGASGAIYAILGVVATLFPNLIVYVYFFPLKMKHAVILWIIIEFLGSFNPYSGIASAAHLGGLIFGIAYGKWLKRKIYYCEELFR